MAKTVRPGSLSNSISPSCRPTRSCATARPRPVPPGDRSRAGRRRCPDQLRGRRAVVLDLDAGDDAMPVDRSLVVTARVRNTIRRGRRPPGSRCADVQQRLDHLVAVEPRGRAGSGRSRARSRRWPAPRPRSRWMTCCTSSWMFIPPSAAAFRPAISVDQRRRAGQALADDHLVYSCSDGSFGCARAAARPRAARRAGFLISCASCRTIAAAVELRQQRVLARSGWCCVTSESSTTTPPGRPAGRTRRHRDIVQRARGAPGRLERTSRREYVSPVSRARFSVAIPFRSTQGTRRSDRPPWLPAHRQRVLRRRRSGARRRTPSSCRWSRQCRRAGRQQVGLDRAQEREDALSRHARAPVGCDTPGRCGAASAGGRLQVRGRLRSAG